jgi:hypothetical protein
MYNPASLKNFPWLASLRLISKKMEIYACSPCLGAAHVQWGLLKKFQRWTRTTTSTALRASTISDKAGDLR